MEQTEGAQSTGDVEMSLPELYRLFEEYPFGSDSAFQVRS